MKWFYNLNIGVKLIISFIIVALIAGVVGAVGIYNISHIEELDAKMYTLMTEPLGDAINYVESYQRVRSNVRDIILTDNQSVMADYENRISMRNKEFDDALMSFEKTLFTEEGKQLTEDLKRNKNRYEEIIEEVIRLAKQDRDEEAYSLLTSESTDKIRTDMDTAYRRMVEIKIATAKETADENKSAAAKATTMMIAIALGGVVLSVILGVFISRIIKNPINKLLNASMEIADGNLDVNIDIDTKDEVGRLGQAFETMVTNVNEVMTNINSASEQVAAGSKQVSDSSMDLSQGATEQASSVEELTAAVEQISSQTQLNAEHAMEAKDIADIARKNAEQGNADMDDMLVAMKEINESSNNISKIIKVIDEIAFQTNILALNAAVEAARADSMARALPLWQRKLET